MNSEEEVIKDVVKRIIDQAPKINQGGRAGRRRICEFPKNHVGPIPNIYVGTSWKYRLQVSECGVHRPLVAGIHGRESEGAFSIVLSFVYADDKDHGDEFIYSGCGGKSSDKTKRLGVQVFDQELKRHNKSLALCCNAPVNAQIGANAGENWRGGKPVRVVRKHSVRERSQYAPEKGYRYDGIYKVVEYYPVINVVTNLKVWTFKLRRDDETPAPWTDEGKRLIEELGLTEMILPVPIDDYVCSKVEDGDTDFIRTTRHLTSKERRTLPKSQIKKIKRRNRFYEFDQRPNSYRAKLRSCAPAQKCDVSMDVDVKPNIYELAYASGASIPYATNSPDAEDVKPSLSVLNEVFTSSDIVIDEMDEILDDEIDRKPNLEILDALIKSEESAICVPVISSVCSMRPVESAMPLRSNGFDEPIKLKICKISSKAWHCQRHDDSKIPQNLRESNYISPTKKQPSWSPSDEIQEMIEADYLNRETWNYLKSLYFHNEEEFLNRVKLFFSCPACSNLVNKPIYTPCKHNVCEACLADKCPYCRAQLIPEEIRSPPNYHLSKILNFLFSKF